MLTSTLITNKSNSTLVQYLTLISWKSNSALVWLWCKRADVTQWSRQTLGLNPDWINSRFVIKLDNIYFAWWIRRGWCNYELFQSCYSSSLVSCSVTKVFRTFQIWFLILISIFIALCFLNEPKSVITHLSD